MSYYILVAWPGKVNCGLRPCFPDVMDGLELNTSVNGPDGRELKQRCLHLLKYLILYLIVMKHLRNVRNEFPFGTSKPF